VQDPAGAERSEMPAAAQLAVPGARVAPLEELPVLLSGMCSSPKATV
jgi:hypothetical protein